MESDEVKNPSSKLAPPEVSSQKQQFACTGYRIPIVYSFGQIDILLEEIEEETEEE
jgi:hypothetical protein